MYLSFNIKIVSKKHENRNPCKFPPGWALDETYKPPGKDPEVATRRYIHTTGAHAYHRHYGNSSSIRLSGNSPTRYSCICVLPKI